LKSWGSKRKQTLELGAEAWDAADDERLRGLRILEGVVRLYQFDEPALRILVCPFAA